MTAKNIRLRCGCFLLKVYVYFDTIVHTLINGNAKLQEKLWMLMILNDDVFPENLRFQRKKKKISQIELSRQTGMDAFLLKSIEAGRCH